jgi:hypothetical protein
MSRLDDLGAAGGYILPDERTARERALAEAFDRSTPDFADVGGDVDLPEAALLYDVELATGGLLPRIWQQIGSCVGAAGARSYAQSQAGDAYFRKTGEEIKTIFPWATWGIGRRLGGLNSRGGGSFGATQAKAVAEWGMLPADDPRLPQATNRGGWLVWSEKIEADWSVPRAWPIPETELAPLANLHRIGYVARIRDIKSLRQALAQGYGVTVASNFGTVPAIKSGLLIGDWNRSWAHQMSVSGYRKHEGLGLVFAIDNQWGPDSNPRCPWLEAKYAGRVNGSFWVTEATMKRIIASSSSEVFAHGETMDFPPRSIDWSSLGMGS